MSTDYSMLKLENQLCFPLYACAKEVVGKYKPYLDEIGLTYTQYITMMVLWEKESSITVKQLGETLFLDSGTLTPLLKKLEKNGFIRRTRNPEDERLVDIMLTAKGMNLREKATGIPQKIGGCIPLNTEEIKTLYTLLYKILAAE